MQRHRREDQSNHRARLKAGTVLSSRGVEQSVEEVYFPSSRVVFACGSIIRGHGWSVLTGIVVGTNLNHGAATIESVHVEQSHERDEYAAG